MTQNQRYLLKKDLIELYKNNGFEINEAEAEISFAIEIISGITPKDLILGIMPDPNDLKKLKETIETRVKTKQPIAQILGKSFFMGQKFDVTKDTLIPRPETELLVKHAVEIIKKNDFKQILDIGTGTGCIACMIAKLTKAQVLGVDISNEALKVSLNNAMHLDLMNKALFRKSDLFSKIRPEEKFDMIVSNPPYIPPQEKQNLQTEVKDFEPENALFTNDEKGIEFYIKIAKQAKDYLNNKGYLIFELGINQADYVKDILDENGFQDIEILEDVSGIKRVISGKIR